MFCFGLIYSETFLFPYKTKSEIVTDMYSKTARAFSRRSADAFLIITSSRKYYVSKSMYANTNIGDTIVTKNGILLGSIMRIEIARLNYSESLDLRFLVEGSGIMFCPFVFVILLLTFVFIHWIPYHPGRVQLTVFLSIFTIVLVVMYIFLQ